MSLELMTADASVPALRKPKEIITEAKERADALMEIVKAQGLSKRIGDKDHIQIEAWQTVGRFFNCTAGADDAVPVEVNGVKGAKAHAVVKDDRSGVVVSEAVSYCMTDEPIWRNKPWFQLASMAQTRAMSKALANKFRWVAVLAGFSGTPAEEITGEEAKPLAGHDEVVPGAEWVIAGEGIATRKWDGTAILVQDGKLSWAAAHDLMPPDGTYELCGPKINSNPDRFSAHVLVRHGTEIYADCPRTFQAIKTWLAVHDGCISATMSIKRSATTAVSALCVC